VCCYAEALCREKGIPFHSDADLQYTFDVVATVGAVQAQCS
jgi:hypothetical protein